MADWKLPNMDNVLANNLVAFDFRFIRSAAIKDPAIKPRETEETAKKQWPVVGKRIFDRAKEELEELVRLKTLEIAFADDRMLRKSGQDGRRGDGGDGAGE